VEYTKRNYHFTVADNVVDQVAASVLKHFNGWNHACGTM